MYKMLLYTRRKLHLPYLIAWRKKKKRKKNADVSVTHKMFAKK